MKRRTLLGALTGAVARAEGSAGALRRGCDYLWSCQGSDGGWHSSTYGLLRSGHSLTPLVLLALASAAERRDRGFPRGLRFVERTAMRSGEDYPCYATALGLRTIIRIGGRGHRLAGPMVAWLKNQQMSSAYGWKRDDPAFGAWGLGSAQPLEAPHAGHIDLSMTRYVMEALATAGVPPTDESMRNGLVFVRRCRNADGSYFFSTTETGANKAGESDGGFAGYGTATADGILAQLAGGDAAVAESIGWLRDRDDPELPPGFPAPARLRYAEGLRYYWAESATRAFGAAGYRRAVPFRERLEAAQRSDGSWANSEPLVKEDDPLIATAFALAALSNL